MAVTTKITVQGEWTETGSGDLGTPRKVHAITEIINLVSGTGNSQADKVWSDSRSLAATSENLDLAGSLTDAFGSTVTFAEVAGLWIHNTSNTSTEILSVGGAASNAFVNWVGNSSDIIKIGAGGVMLLTAPVDGYAVTAGTGDILKIDAGSDTITYEIVIWGRSA